MPTPTIDNETEKRLRSVWKVRHAARTNPWVLAWILGYNDVIPEVHGPLVDALPQFRGGTDSLLSNGEISYTPAVPLWKLETRRKRLFLYPRGHLKTSIITQLGIVQWILNYPNVRILLTTATGDLNTTVLQEIKSHFQYNSKFRSYFPDYCPQKSLKDFGNSEEFSVPNSKKQAKREPTVSTSSVGKTIAGKHYEVLMCSDMVDKENVRTSGGVQTVIDHFKYMDPLLERHEESSDSPFPNHGWITVEGTSYSFADLYSHILNENGFRITEFPNGVQTLRRNGWTFVHGDAEVDPEKQTTIWPARFPWSELKKMERSMGPALYSAQMRNRPMADEGGLISEDELMKPGFWFNRAVLEKIRSQLRIYATVDLAGMEADSRGDYTVLSVSGFDHDGRCYILEIRRGHFSPSEVINHLFDIWALYKPVDIKVEKDAHARVLGHFITRETHKRQVFPNIVLIPRDTRTSKTQRIKGLQPWFASKVIRFYNEIECKTDLVREIVEFPSSKYDDILDTLADQMQNRDGGTNYDVIPQGEPAQIPWGAMPARPEFAGFDEATNQAIWRLDNALDETLNYHAVTGL